ncbi:sigma factor-like helix-turn-helix DNA-binding protein [Micromonospora sp. b486]|uniref:RNA polymerase sigma factor n=1 Tax=Micromonospora sp. b486 TaxID=3053986 RepID=UPI00259CD40C|nr:sigma factor-like helix-turn-helix DNA-binding protein [Micromonospora sp. b486]MDM4784680.1 sigma factor-like helix-turn-helix DNA-binding protein [Micromonospora sp. b486]
MTALATLPIRDQAIVVLRHWEDQSVATVAKILGISVSAVKMRGRPGVEPDPRAARRGLHRELTRNAERPVRSSRIDRGVLAVHERWRRDLNPRRA